MSFLCCAETRKMVCYACSGGLHDPQPSEKSKGECLLLTSCGERFNCHYAKMTVWGSTLLPFIQLMQADPHKLDFRSDPLARFSGAGGLGPMPLPPAHDLTRPPSLFSAAGACLFNVSVSQLVKCNLFIYVCAQIVAVNNVQQDKQDSGCQCL